MNMRKYKIAALVLVLALLLSGCGEKQEQSSSSSSSSNVDNSISQTSTSQSEMFSDRDFEVGYETSESALIQLNGDSAQCDSDAVQISGNIVTITDEGTYILSGTLDNGMVMVEAEDTDKLHIVFNNVTISNSTSAALYIKQADKVFLTTATNSENTLSNGGEYVAIDDNNIDSVIFSKADLTLNGGGTLTIEADAGHGVVSKDDLIITSGTYKVTSASHGFCGKDSVRIANGNFTITSGKDGIQAENTDDTSLGFLYIEDGSFDVTAQGDGFSAGNYLQIEEGNYTLVTGVGSTNAVTKDNGFGASTTTTEDTASTKGIKATGDLLLNGGTFSIDSEDDGLHSNANLSVSGGTFQIATGDDGLHADASLTVSAGNLEITRSYEGLEGLTIDITGGQISLISSDDGLNAAGGNDQSGFSGMEGGRRGPDNFAANENAYIHISGGTIYIDASGDGIDSNGNLTISGGEIYVSGPTSGGDGALDYNGEGTISGGIIIATGSSQMAQNFGDTSTQGTMMVSVSSQPAGSIIKLADSSGKELVSWTADKTFDSVIISCPDITQGSSYTLTAGSAETQITMDTLVYGSGGGMGGPGAQAPGNMGGGQPGGGRVPMDTPLQGNA